MTPTEETEKTYLDYNRVLFAFTLKAKIPLIKEKVVEAIEVGECPFSCKCCHNYALMTCLMARNCVRLRDYKGYGQSALFYRKGLPKSIKRQLLEIVKEVL